MYINDDYSNYKYLVELHDNYVVLSNSSHISGSSGDYDTVSAVAQFLQPSNLSIPFTYYSYSSRSFPDVSSSFSNSVFDRADFNLIFISSFIIFVIWVFVVNQLSKLVKKGGVFGSN